MDVSKMCLLQAYSIQKIETDFNNIPVWFFTTEDLSLAYHLKNILSKKEQQYALSIRHKKRQSSYIIAHAMLRLLLSRYSNNKITANTWILTYNSYGKPCVQTTLNQPILHFSISYSGDAIAIAITSIAPIGIDFEHINGMEKNDIPWFVFTDNEKAQLKAINCKLPDYLALWTLKEAVAKALGLGIFIDFGKIDIAPTLASAAVKYGDIHIPVNTHHIPLIVNNLPSSLALAMLPSIHDAVK